MIILLTSPWRWIFPKTKIFLNRFIMYSNAPRECCGKQLYHKEKQVCCAGKIVDKVAGEHTKCCINKPYDSRYSSCCNANVSLLWSIFFEKPFFVRKNQCITIKTEAFRLRPLSLSDDGQKASIFIIIYWFLHFFPTSITQQSVKIKHMVS